jgi:hypothetical protein
MYHCRKNSDNAVFYELWFKHHGLPGILNFYGCQRVNIVVSPIARQHYTLAAIVSSLKIAKGACQ